MTAKAMKTQKPVVTIQGQRITTNSLAVADYFGKRHDNVLRDIRNLLVELPKNHRLNFEETIVTRENPKGGDPIKSPSFEITRDGFTLLAMGFTGKKALQFQLAYIDAFNAMEQALQKNHIGNPVDGSDVFHFNYGEQLIRVISHNGETWFVSRDVAKALGLRDSMRMVQRLGDNDKSLHRIMTNGGAQVLSVISEMGLYSIIHRCRQDDARGFHQWVITEVMPAIHKSELPDKHISDIRNTENQGVSVDGLKELAAHLKSAVSQIDRMLAGV